MKKEISDNHDALRFGVNAGVKGDLAPPHPLQATIQSEAKFWADKKRFGTEAIYGSTFNIRKDLDAQILSKYFTAPFPLAYAVQKLVKNSAVYVEGDIETRVYNDSINDQVRNIPEICVRRDGKIRLVKSRESAASISLDELREGLF